MIKRAGEHDCLMADHNNKAGTCETIYSVESSAQHAPLLSASSSSSLLLSKITQFVSRDEPECLGTLLASTNVAASVVAAVGEQEDKEGLKRRVIGSLPEEYKAVTGRSLVVDPDVANSSNRQHQHQK